MDDRDRSYFGFRPDWRAEVQIALLTLKVCALVGLPVWIGIIAWRWIGSWVTVLFIWALLSAAIAEEMIRRTFAYRRKVREGRIILDDEAARLPLPGKGWTRAPWEDVQALTVIRAGGLFGAGLIRVRTRLHRVAVPSYVRDPEVLIEEIVRRAGLDEAHRSWWATTWRRSA